MSNLPTRQALLQDADLCVKCGVCLPHCPTYALHREETESPRGRITLLQGLVSEKLQATSRVMESLDHCLSCGRCDKVCPANVPYAQLMDNARFVLQTTPPASVRRRRRMARLLASPRAMRVLAILTQVIRKSGLDTLIGGLFGPSTRVGRALAWMPDTISVRRQEGAAQAPPQAIIFPGCITSAFEQDIVDSATKIGARLGIAWHEPQRGLCCGGLYQHIGDKDASQELISRAVQSFAEQPGLPIATVSSGCGKSLSDNLGSANTLQATAERSRLIDIHSLLLQHLANSTAPVFVPATEPVAVYLPCSMAGPERDHLLRLLNHVPAAQVHVVSGGYGCCGAAGDHMTAYPETADALAENLIDEVIASRVKHVVIPNLGCAWHWRANLRKHDSGIKVSHPLQWLSAHLKAREH